MRSLSISSRESVREMASKDGELRVFIVAGEVSGDIIASRFMNSLKNLSPFPIRFAGVGGSMMSKHGLNSLFPLEDISVMGIWELLPHLSKFRARLKETVESALVFRPHVVLTVDSKGFNFRFLKHLRAIYDRDRLASLRHFHYVAPSFWAWRGGEARLKGLSEFVDHIFCILPFEAEMCRSNGVAATFVGHPTLEDALELNVNNLTVTNAFMRNGKFKATEKSLERNMGFLQPFHTISCSFCSVLDPALIYIQILALEGATIISVLPGSRLQEVKRMLSIFSKTMELLKDSHTELTAVIHVAPNKDVENYIKQAVHEWPISVVLLPGGSPFTKYNSFSASRVALCASGTVAVELQLARLPCVVAYRAHLLTEWYIRYKAKIPYVSLPNIVLESSIIPEALFGECTPSNLASLLMDLMRDTELREKQISAANTFFDLVNPVKRVSENSTKKEHVLFESTTTPSMIASSAVLNS
ncbi:hypothetical protein RD792_013524 [Penstemon davidsonii]|uniref:lipid-A-disaccharide synthase n=1 Tax=Penstemon davidsonii TaxID=160366 RepID=A0ABR0CTR6_9LAMI|nr:hypothetical protein RD792_013524 [Penstemon davidsonii]